MLRTQCQSTKFALLAISLRFSKCEVSPQRISDLLFFLNEPYSNFTYWLRLELNSGNFNFWQTPNTFITTDLNTAKNLNFSIRCKWVDVDVWWPWIEEQLNRTFELKNNITDQENGRQLNNAYSFILYFTYLQSLKTTTLSCYGALVSKVLLKSLKNKILNLQHINWTKNKIYIYTSRPNSVDKLLLSY